MGRRKMNRWNDEKEGKRGECKGDEQFGVDGSVAIGRWMVAKRQWGWWRKESSWPRGSIPKRVKLPPLFTSSSMLAPRIRAARSSLESLHTVSKYTAQGFNDYASNVLAYSSHSIFLLLPICHRSEPSPKGFWFTLFGHGRRNMTFHCYLKGNSDCEVSRVKLARWLTLASPSNRFATWHLSWPTLAQRLATTFTRLPRSIHFTR